VRKDVLYFSFFFLFFSYNGCIVSEFDIVVYKCLLTTQSPQSLSYSVPNEKERERGRERERESYI